MPKKVRLTHFFAAMTAQNRAAAFLRNVGGARHKA